MKAWKITSLETKQEHYRKTVKGAAKIANCVEGTLRNKLSNTVLHVVVMGMYTIERIEIKP